MDKKILIIDAMNLFIRNYVVDPSLSATGQPIGGCKGFLKSLQKLTREIKPDNLIVVWDGGGGSKKRKAMAKQYKDGRKPLKLNRAYSGMNALEESQNRYDQMSKVMNYLNQMPIVQLMIEDVEADDVIAYICHMKSISDKVKIIVSMDKDFYQLCSEKTIVYRPIKNEFLTTKRILEQFKIHPNNFALARAIDGDKSDNLEGIKGAGLKTIAKRLSFLSESQSYNLDDLFSYCKTNRGELKLFHDILSQKDLVELNYKLMQLYTPALSYKSSQHVRETINNFLPQFNRTEVLKMMVVDGIAEYKWDALFQKFRSIIADPND
tara:strand:+ start:1566 stop:2531 length:966 start_codon:yes stop_codon:yes gene_type:complete